MGQGVVMGGVPGMPVACRTLAWAKEVVLYDETV